MKWATARERLLRLATPESSARAGEARRTEAPPCDRRAHEMRGGLDSDPGGNGRRRRADDRGVPEDRPDPIGLLRASSLCVASGKGGTGKSVVTASLAYLLSSRGRALIVDADMGVGNAHILQDVSPERSLVDVVEGRLSMREILMPCSGQVDLLAGGCGVPRMSTLSPYELHLIATGLERLEAEYRYLLVDSAAGVATQTMAFARVCDLALLVTTFDLTAMTDAYAFLKVHATRHRGCPTLLLVNRVNDEGTALDVAERIARVSQRFLDCAPVYIGWLPEDPAVARCVNQRAPVVLLEPNAPFSRALRQVSVRVLEELGRLPARGAGRRLLGEVGYPAEPN